MYIYIYMCVYICICVYIYVYAELGRLLANCNPLLIPDYTTHTHTYIYIYIYIHTYIHVHLHICMYIYILYNATERRLFWGHGESGSLSRLTSDLHTARVFVRPAQLPPVSVFLYPSVNMCESPSVYMSKYVSPQKRLLICDSNCLRSLTLCSHHQKTHSNTSRRLCFTLFTEKKSINNKWPKQNDRAELNWIWTHLRLDMDLYPDRMKPNIHVTHIRLYWCVCLLWVMGLCMVRYSIWMQNSEKTELKFTLMALKCI